MASTAEVALTTQLPSVKFSSGLPIPITEDSSTTNEISSNDEISSDVKNTSDVSENKKLSPVVQVSLDEDVPKVNDTDNNSAYENENLSESSLEQLTRKRLKFPCNITCGYLNINSIRNKLHDLDILLTDKLDVIAIGETKLDDSFPTKQFCLKGYSSPFRLDISANSGGVLVYVREHLPSKHLTSFNIPLDMQVIPIELNLRKVKWLIVSVYRPPRQPIDYFLNSLSTLLDFYSSTYENYLLMGDFNCEPDVSKMETFMTKHSLYNFIKTETCWKASKGTCIDLVLSNKKHSFNFSGVAETGLSDHHSLVYTMFKSKFNKQNPKKLRYRCYKNFDKDHFSKTLKEQMCNIGDYAEFHRRFIILLDQFAPMKIRFIRANNKPYINKTL